MYVHQQSIAKKVAASLLFILILLVNGKAQLIDAPNQTKVIIVGVLNWQANLTAFSTKNRKDKALEAYFLKAGVPTDNITALYDKDASLNNIKKALQTAENYSNIVFYYAGHGLKHQDAIYFANYDIQPQNPGNSGFNLNHLYQSFGNLKTKKIILMADCCYSGGLLKQAQKIAATNKKVLCMSSATASNLSTGNWTFSQTILDCLQGVSYADSNNDNWIDLKEMQYEIEGAMQYRERQKSGFASYNWDLNSKIASVATSSQYNHLSDCYKWAPYNNSWSCVRVLKKDAEESLCEFFFYADKVQKVLSNDALRPMHFVRHQKGTKVQVEWESRWYPATVLQTEGDFAYIKYDNYDHSWNEWVLYDRMRKGTEQKVQVWDGNAYYPAVILENNNDLFYIHYLNYPALWDCWVGKDKIK